MKIQRQIEAAAKVIQEADALFITAGVGIGVDAGFPDFRYGDEFWNFYPPARDMGVSFNEMINPYWFDAKPHFAWGYYAHLLEKYRKRSPHLGFELLKMWAEQKGIYFIFTSNIDGQFQRIGFDHKRIFECYGSMHFVQCAHNCKGEIWHTLEYSLFTDPKTHLALDPLPSCKYCGSILRPNVLMNNDLTWNKRRAVAQGNQLHVWHRKLKDFGYKLAIIELGAGNTVPTVRHESEGAAQEVGGTLIRINPREPQVPHGHISIPLGAAEATERINQVIMGY